MPELSRAVFLSYASQDAEAAGRIASALRGADVEVWFDQSELRGGDAWDHRIREQIRDCRLFVAVISAHTEARDEGYFRREWKLAVDRTRDMAEKKAFIVPVVIDGTTERGATVPEKFRELQWTRLPNGETPPAFVERVQHLLLAPPPAAIHAPANAESGQASVQAQTTSSLKRGLLVGVGAVVLAAVAYLAIDKHWTSRSAVWSPTVAAGSAPIAFTPPPHSIAVLPFANLSEDKEQEYFSEGLTEELLNSLAEVNGLQVAARASSFSFQGEHPDIATVAHKLNVGSVLEGSVRRSGHTVRITAQLSNGITGFHLWSKTYDRDVGEVLKLQTEIATAVAEALKVTLLGDISARIELGGTRNPAAFDAYLRASKADQAAHDADVPPAFAAYTEAIRLDPDYALAFAGRSLALTNYAGEVATGAAVREDYQKAEVDARQAIALAPDLAEAHLALGAVFESGTLDFASANEEYTRALALVPGSARVLRYGGVFAAYMGHFETGIGALRRVLVLDPLSRRSYGLLARALYLARRYGEAATAYAEVISLDPNHNEAYGLRGIAFYELGDLERARASCETKRNFWESQQCLAVVYNRLGRHAEAEAELAKAKATMGDAAAYQYAQTYAQWGDRTKALEWLDTAIHLRDPGLELLKTDPLMDPLREEPRFQVAMRELKFPD